MFGYDNQKQICAVLGDPGADKNVVIFRARVPCEILAARAISGVALTAGAGTTTTLTIYNGGTSGTAQTIVGSALGGTTVDWEAQVAKSFNLGDGTMAAGEYLWVKYDEEGTVAPFITILVDYVEGVGA